jgi:hypothetical protein
MLATGSSGIAIYLLSKKFFTSSLALGDFGHEAFCFEPGMRFALKFRLLSKGTP